MKLLYNSLRACLVLLAILGSSTVKAQQFLTQINSWNAYIHLPAGYNSGNQYYPTIIYFPGLDNVGTNPAKAIATGPGAYIQQGWNGNVTVDGNVVEFIVVSLQPSSAWPNEALMNQRIQTLKNNYRIDPNRLYLTGFSLGGWCSSTFVSADNYGGPYNYAGQIAAVVNVIGVKPEDNQPYPALFDNFANSGGRYLGFEQKYDGRDIKTIVNRMNNTKPNSAIYVQTNFGNGGHCCPDNFFGGNGTNPSNFVLDGVNQNLYQWLARQSKGSTPPNTPPVANAGPDRAVSLPIGSVQINGSGSDANGIITSYQWTKLSGPSGGNISGSNNPTMSVSNLTEGVYQYQLRVTDNGGASATDVMVLTVNAADQGNQPPVANAGQDKYVTLPTNTVSLTGSGSDPDGSISSYLWQKISGPSGGNIQSANSSNTNITSLNEGVYTYRLRVTDNMGATATDDVMVTVTANQGGGTTGGTIKVNVYGGSNPFNDPQWNNWNTSSLTSPYLKYTDGSTSGIRASLTDQAGMADNGNGYASSASTPPSQVLRFNSYNTSNRVLTITGLVPGNSYDMQFFGSRKNTGNKTVVQWGNKRDTINTDNNSTDYAILNGLVANSSGILAIDLYRIGTYNYLAGFTLTALESRPFTVNQGAPPVIEKDIPSEAAFHEGETVINTFPNPFTNQVNMILRNDYAGDYTVSLADNNGRVLRQFRYNKFIGETRQTINPGNLARGTYMLIIQMGKERLIHKIIRQ